MVYSFVMLSGISFIYLIFTSNYSSSLLTHSSFLIPHSSFLIPHSSFLIPHSSFLFHFILNCFILLLLIYSSRMFLLRIELPNEAPRIDRIMEAFATQYHQHNPNAFSCQGTTRRDAGREGRGGMRKGLD